MLDERVALARLQTFELLSYVRDWTHVFALARSMIIDDRHAALSNKQRCSLFKKATGHQIQHRVCLRNLVMAQGVLQQS